MVRALSLAAQMLAAVGALAQSVKGCPTLPANSGLEWSYRKGPDFDLCYATESANQKPAFGIYLGNHPSFDTSKGARARLGSVAGKDVVWYRGFGDDTESPSLQTVLTLGSGHQPYSFVAHVWVRADDESLLRRYLAILQRIDFRD